MKSFFINCDLGEGCENDNEIMRLIDACSIACGGHFGDYLSVSKTVDLALENKVKIGAHPSYPDKVNFGRKSIIMSEIDFKKSINNQLYLIQLVVNEQNTIINHIKPHGALYNDLVKNEELCEWFLDSILKFKHTSSLYVPYKSTIENLAKLRGFKIEYEAFGDRNYNNDLTLVDRKLSNAIISNHEEVYQHIKNIVKNETVTSATGDDISLKATTFCIHSDTLNSVDILQYLKSKMKR